MPRFASRPARCLSAANRPCGCPWNARSRASPAPTNCMFSPSVARGLPCVDRLKLSAPAASCAPVSPSAASDLAFEFEFQFELAFKTKSRSMLLSSVHTAWNFIACALFTPCVSMPRGYTGPVGNWLSPTGSPNQRVQL